MTERILKAVVDELERHAAKKGSIKESVKEVRSVSFQDISEIQNIDAGPAKGNEQICDTTENINEGPAQDYDQTEKAVKQISINIEPINNNNQSNLIDKPEYVNGESAYQQADTFSPSRETNTSTEHSSNEKQTKLNETGSIPGSISLNTKESENVSSLKTNKTKGAKKGIRHRNSAGKVNERDHRTVLAYKKTSDHKSETKKPTRNNKRCNRQVTKDTRPSLDVDIRVSNIVSKSGEIDSTGKVKERSRHPYLPDDLRRLIEEHFMKDSSKPSRKSSQKSVFDSGTTATKGDKSGQGSVPGSSIKHTKEPVPRLLHEIMKDEKHVPSILTNKTIPRNGTGHGLVTPVHITNGDAKDDTNKRYSQSTYSKPGVILIENPDVSPRGRTRYRLDASRHYDAQNTSTQMIILNNKHSSSSRLWKIPRPKSEDERQKMVNPRRHIKDRSFHECGHFHRRCATSPGPERFRSSSSLNILLTKNRPSSENIGERLFEARASINPRRHRSCQPVKRQPQMDFSKPVKAKDNYVFEWERVYSENPRPQWTRPASEKRPVTRNQTVERVKTARS
ncbi:hypothetical protein MAR_008221 [Mya arenaria]|uniref:Uncharacterized protein n=1 Tax=Mya arenaria TaxID=6604 RepID=A0ABY7DVB8_MYAAR|nr:uncharacterized protein LOC128230356 [Mya arenaria]WAR01663.1 hypothetical protein MAR_008221 [Mya arenaria]